MATARSTPDACTLLDADHRVVLALHGFWRIAHRSHVYWSGRLMWGSCLMGWGIFNVLEGVVDHHILGVHHVNELVSAAHRGAYDIGFLAWGAGMIVGGWVMWRSGRLRHSAEIQALRLAARHGG